MKSSSSWVCPNNTHLPFFLVVPSHPLSFLFVLGSEGVATKPLKVKFARRGSENRQDMFAWNPKKGSPNKSYPYKWLDLLGSMLICGLIKPGGPACVCCCFCHAGIIRPDRPSSHSLIVSSIVVMYTYRYRCIYVYIYV